MTTYNGLVLGWKVADGWAIILNHMKINDEEMLENLKDELNNLLVFASIHLHVTICVAS